MLRKYVSYLLLVALCMTLSSTAEQKEQEITPFEVLLKSPSLTLTQPKSHSIGDTKKLWFSSLTPLDKGKPTKTPVTAIPPKPNNPVDVCRLYPFLCDPLYCTKFPTHPFCRIATPPVLPPELQVMCNQLPIRPWFCTNPVVVPDGYCAFYTQSYFCAGYNPNVKPPEIDQVCAQLGGAANQYWFCAAQPVPPASHCQLYPTSWFCQPRRLRSQLTERQRPAELQWVCNEYPALWICDDSAATPHGFCDIYNESWACRDLHSDKELLSQTSHRPSDFEWICQQFPSLWMCLDSVVPPVGFCDNNATSWACQNAVEKSKTYRTETKR